ncbi:MAG TPA: GNAT family N-acetyltransferase [Pseudoxanthomonas sp.]|nr:GNAT family N-acetyltransferase [Pseudoxanthomonas sp.]
MTPKIDHQPESSRFSAAMDGREGTLAYRSEPGILELTHTYVPDEIAGRGIAGALVEAALEHARRERLKVVPCCSYAAAYIARHPQHADLVD